VLRKPFIRWPLTALLLWLAWVGARQTLDTLLSEDDWTDDYSRGTATIVDSRAEYWDSSGTSRGTWKCVLIVEWTHGRTTRRDEPIWLRGGISSDRMEDDCGRERFGEQVPVWIGGTDAAEPWLVEPGNRTGKPGTAVVNGLQTLFFLGLLALLWRPRRKGPGAGAHADTEDATGPGSS
jgi:hypothetical protein